MFPDLGLMINAVTEVLRYQEMFPESPEVRRGLSQMLRFFELCVAIMEKFDEDGFSTVRAIHSDQISLFSRQIF